MELLIALSGRSQLGSQSFNLDSQISCLVSQGAYLQLKVVISIGQNYSLTLTIIELIICCSKLVLQFLDSNNEPVDLALQLTLTLLGLLSLCSECVYGDAAVCAVCGYGLELIL